MKQRIQDEATQMRIFLLKNSHLLEKDVKKLTNSEPEKHLNDLHIKICYTRHFILVALFCVTSFIHLFEVDKLQVQNYAYFYIFYTNIYIDAVCSKENWLMKTYLETLPRKNVLTFLNTLYPLYIYICIYIHIYIYYIIYIYIIYTHIYMHHIFIYIHICTYIHPPTHTQTHTHTHTQTHIHR